VLAEQGYFFVGGRYANLKDDEIRLGQMYVQYQIPEELTQPYPVVMWHGGNQTGTNFMGTPDGRKGWGDHFLQLGYAVYIVDQLGRARSGYFVRRSMRTPSWARQGGSKTVRWAERGASRATR
jgi:hypothetical protein